MSYNIRIGIGMDQQTNLKRIAEVINKIQPDYVGLDLVDHFSDSLQIGLLVHTDPDADVVAHDS